MLSQLTLYNAVLRPVTMRRGEYLSRRDSVRMARRFNAGNAGAATGAVQHRPMADFRLRIADSVGETPTGATGTVAVPRRAGFSGRLGVLSGRTKSWGRNCFVSFVKGWAGGA